MLHKFKALGTVLIAMLSLSAVAASVASGNGQYTAASYPTAMTATSPSGNDVFTTEGGSWECNTHYEATLNAASSDLTVKTQTTGCKAFGFASATITMGSCDYLYTTPIKLGTSHEWTIPVDIKCTDAAAPIRIVAGNCEVTIGEQSLGGHAIATTTTQTPAKPDDIDIRHTLTGITYTVTKDGFLCTFSGTGVKSGGALNQKAEITLASTNGRSVTISG